MYVCKHSTYIFIGCCMYILVCKYKILRACKSINETMGMWLIRVGIYYIILCYAMLCHVMLDFSFALKLCWYVKIRRNNRNKYQISITQQIYFPPNFSRAFIISINQKCACTLQSILVQSKKLSCKSLHKSFVIVQIIICLTKRF